MFSRVRAIVVKEFIQLRRDPRSLAIVLAMPAMLLLLFAYAINTVVDHIATVVDDESHDAYSRSFVAALTNSTYFTVVGYVNDRDAARAAIADGSAKVAVIIPPNFEDDILSGSQVTAQLIVDGSDPNYAQTALFAGGLVAQVQSQDLVALLASRLGRTGGIGGLELRPVVLYNPGMLSVTFMIPGLIGFILQFQTLSLTALAIVRERERGTLEQLVVSPIRSWELMLGKMIPYVITAFVAVSVALAVGRFWFGVPIVGSLPLLAAIAVIFLLSTLGMGLFVSTISQTQMQAFQVSMFFQLPAILMSGFIFAREGMPGILQAVGLLFPLTFFLPVLRGIILKGVGLGVLWPSVLPLVFYGALVFTLSATRFQKRVD